MRRRQWGVALVALLMGFRSSAGVGAWLAVAGILAVFTLALTWIAAIAGLSATSIEGAYAFSYPLIFLPFLSSAFVPTHTMPGPLRESTRSPGRKPPVTTAPDLLGASPTHSTFELPVPA